jgi:hypothetical protein
MAVAIESNGSDGPGFVTQVVLGGVGVSGAEVPGDSLSFVDQGFWRAQRNAMPGGEFFRSPRDQHHVVTFLQYRTRQQDRVAHVFDGGDGTRFQRSPVHDDGVELHLAIHVQVRTEARIEGRIVFENHDGGLHSIDRGPTAAENSPASFERAANPGAAILDRFVRNVPRATVNNEGRFQGLENDRQT